MAFFTRRQLNIAKRTVSNIPKSKSTMYGMSPAEGQKNKETKVLERVVSSIVLLANTY